MQLIRYTNDLNTQFQNHNGALHCPRRVDQFRQCADGDAQRCHIVHGYEDKLTCDEHQQSERTDLTYDIHHPNQFEHI